MSCSPTHQSDEFVSSGDTLVGTPQILCQRGSALWTPAVKDFQASGRSVSLFLPQPQQRGVFVRRLNRFAVEVEVDGEPVVAHLPNSGRMTELLVPGHPVVLVERGLVGRKTGFDMLLVQYEGHWVSVDSRLPSILAFRALGMGALAPWSAYTNVRREVTYLDSRLDLELREGDRRCLIETKSVNLVLDGCALFPDAPTIRGARHLRTLVQAKKQGLEAGALFIIQRADATRFSPHTIADPIFSQALREAMGAGVEVRAYVCHIQPDLIVLGQEVPLVFGV